MNISITGRHLRLTPAIRSYVEEKVQKAQRYFNHITRTQVVLSVEKLTHQAEIIVHAPKQMFRALAQGGDLYAAVDLASDKIDAQLKKHKERIRNHHGRGPSDEEKADVPVPTDGVRFSVVKPVPVRPMTREEAVGEMDTMGYNFWMFLERDSKQIQVIYRRQDDSFGLLKPVKWSGK